MSGAPRTTVVRFGQLVDWMKENGISERRTRALIQDRQIRRIQLTPAGQYLYNVSEVKDLLQNLIFNGEQPNPPHL